MDEDDRRGFVKSNADPDDEESATYEAAEQGGSNNPPQTGPNPQNDTGGGAGGPQIPTIGEKLGGALKGVTEKAREKVGEGINNAKAALGGAAERVQEKVQEIGGNVKDAAREAGERVKDTVKEKVEDAIDLYDGIGIDHIADNNNTGDDSDVRPLNPDDKGVDRTKNTDDPIARPESTAEDWNKVMTDDETRYEVIGEAQRQARMAQKEKRHMAYMNAAKAMAPQLAAAGVKSYADMLAGVRTLTNNFLSGRGMSTASTLLGETLSSADTAGDMLRRSKEDFGIMQNADLEAIKDTAKGRMMMARNRSEQQGVAFANVMIGRALTDPQTGEQRDVSQLDMDDILRVYNECRAGITRAQAIMQDPDSTRGDRHHAAGMMQQYRDVVKGLDSRNKELGKLAREQAAYNITRDQDSRRAQREMSAAALQQRYDNGTDAQRWAWDTLGNKSGVDLDDDGVPRKPTQIPGMIKTLDARISELEAAGEGPSDDTLVPTPGSPEYQMLTQLREKALAKQTQYRQAAVDRARAARMNEDGTEAGSVSRRRLIQNHQAVINRMMKDFGVPIDGRPLSELVSSSDPAVAGAAGELMRNPEFIRLHNEITLAENANISENLQNRLTRRDPTLGIDPEMAEAIRARLKDLQLSDKEAREAGGYVSPDSEFRDYADFYNEILDRSTSTALQRTKHKVATREAELDAEGTEYADDAEWNVLKEAQRALENIDPGDDPAKALMERDVAMAQAGVDLQGARAARREAAAKKKAEERALERVGRMMEREEARLEAERAKEKKEEEKKEAKAREKHRKACEGRMSVEEYRRYINELESAKASAPRRTKDRIERQIQAVKTGQALAEAKRKVKSIPMTQEQRDAVINYLEDLGYNITTRLSATTKGNYQVPKATQGEFIRICRDLETLTSPMNSDLRTKTKNELNKLRFEEGSTEKELLQALYDTLTSPPNLTSTWGNTYSTAFLIDKAAQDLKEFRANEKKQAEEDAARSTDPSATKTARKAAKDLATNTMRGMLSERFGDRQIPLSPRGVREAGIEDADSIIEFMTTDPEYIRTYNRFMNNQNKQLWEDVQASIEKKSFLGMDNIDFLGLMNNLQDAYNQDYEARKDNNELIEEDEHSFGTIASAYKDVFHARLDALNDKTDISLRSLKNRLETEDADTTVPLSDRSEVYKLSAMLKDALEDTDITPQNVREKAETIRDLRAKLNVAKEKEKAAARAARSKNESIAQPEGGNKKKSTTKRRSVSTPRNKTPTSDYIDGLWDLGTISEAEKKELIGYFNSIVQVQSAGGLIGRYSSLHNQLNATSDPAERKSLVNKIEVVQDLAKNRVFSGGAKVTPESIQRMQDDIDEYYKSQKPPEPPAPPQEVVTQTSPGGGEVQTSPQATEVQEHVETEEERKAREEKEKKEEEERKKREEELRRLNGPPRPSAFKEDPKNKGRYMVPRNMSIFDVINDPQNGLLNLSKGELTNRLLGWGVSHKSLEWLLKKVYEKTEGEDGKIHPRDPHKVFPRKKAEAKAQDNTGGPQSTVPPAGGAEETYWSLDENGSPVFSTSEESNHHYLKLANGDQKTANSLVKRVNKYLKELRADTSDENGDYATRVLNGVMDPHMAEKVKAPENDWDKVVKVQKAIPELYKKFGKDLFKPLDEYIDKESSPDATDEEKEAALKKLNKAVGKTGGAYVDAILGKYVEADVELPSQLPQGKVFKIIIDTYREEGKDNPYIRRFFNIVDGEKK